jgi:hypothetical protein
MTRRFADIPAGDVMGGHESIDKLTRLVAQMNCSFAHISAGGFTGGHESIDELTRLAAQLTCSFAHILAGGVTGGHESILRDLPDSDSSCTVARTPVQSRKIYCL